MIVCVENSKENTKKKKTLKTLATKEFMTIKLQHTRSANKI